MTGKLLMSRKMIKMCVAACLISQDNVVGDLCTLPMYYYIIMYIINVIWHYNVHFCCTAMSLCEWAVQSLWASCLYRDINMCFIAVLWHYFRYYACAVTSLCTFSLYWLHYHVQWHHWLHNLTTVTSLLAWFMSCSFTQWIILSLYCDITLVHYLSTLTLLVTLKLHCDITMCVIPLL